MKIIFILLGFLISTCVVNGQDIDYDSLDRARYNYFIDRYSQHYGKKLPNIEFLNDKGNIVQLTDYNQQLLVINIWATWCSPCIRKIPYIQSAMKRLKYHGISDFDWINISIDTDTMAWKKMVSTMEIPGFNIISNKNDMKNHFMAQGTPTYIIVNEDFQIIGYELNGPETIEMEYQIIRALEGISCADSYKEIYDPYRRDYTESFKNWMIEYTGESHNNSIQEAKF